MSDYVYFICAFKAGDNYHKINEWLEQHCPGSQMQYGYRTTYRKVILNNEKQAFLFRLAWEQVLIGRPSFEDWMTPKP